MTDNRDLAFDAATALGTLLAETIVELVRAGSLGSGQAAKILLRAEGFIDALRFQKDPGESLPGHRLRLELHRLAVGSVTRQVEQRLALRPYVHALRARHRSLAAACRRRKLGKS